MNKIGIFYGPLGGSTERVAFKVAKEIGEEHAELVKVRDASTADLDRFDTIIFGLSTLGKHTWDANHENNDWDLFLPKLNEIDFSSKKVALFGLGDSVQYSLHFVDALGILAEKLLALNANIIGRVSPDGYTFEDSQGLIDGEFIGLPIDEDFEDDLTDERVKNWIAEIKPQFI